ncbi:MAG: hydrogenase iron-sulfur subunit [Desulfohalobiaceae bacterium]|nr:hydrogenase iron-sulfur subunit [Desulfohalobiaceae bacterium]
MQIVRGPLTGCVGYRLRVSQVCLPCTDKLDYAHVLRAFEQGFDGVFAAG